MAKPRSNSFDLALVARELEAAKIQRPNGHVSFPNFQYGEFFAVLETSIVFPESVPDSEQNRIIHEAVFSAAATGPITQTSLFAHINRLERSYLAKPPSTFVLLTTLSLRSDLTAESVSLDESTFTFSRARPKRFDQSALGDLLRANDHVPLPDGHLIVRVRVAARSASEALTTAVSALDLLRGIWNFRLNRRIASRFILGLPQPINQIRPGPVHTLHYPDGRLALEGQYSYEPSFRTRDKPSNPRREWPEVKREERQIRKLLAYSPYNLDLRSAFIRYARALDGIDFESSFLKLWSLLEFLTATVGGPYKRTIDRCLFRVRERDLERQILEHLREQRNATVHGSPGRDRFEAWVFQLKRYVEDLFLFHLQARNQFESIEKAGEFLDLPHDPDELRRKLLWLRRALRFRSPRRQVGPEDRRHALVSSARITRK